MFQQRRALPHGSCGTKRKILNLKGTIKYPSISKRKGVGIDLGDFHTISCKENKEMIFVLSLSLWLDLSDFEISFN